MLVLFDMRRNGVTLRPRLNALGKVLPASWQRFVRSEANGLRPASLLADLFLSYPRDPEGFDPKLAKRSFFLVDQTVGRYFRLEVHGAENIPPGRALLIGCHSGVLPWDATCLVPAIYRATGRFSRNVGHEFFGAIGAVESYLRARGVVIGRYAKLRELLERDELVLLFPGGAEDMRRPFWERYRVKPHKGFARGRGGYIRLALETKSPIVPLAIIGAEETHWLLTDIPPVARLLRLPYFPIVLSPVPLPAHMYIRFGTPIHLEEPPEAAKNPHLVDRLNTKVRRSLQSLIDDTRRHRHGIFWSRYDGNGAA